MARPKKVQHKKRPDGTYEAKVTIGYDMDGKPIRKSFYSAESWEKAKAEGERYKIERELAIQRGEIATKENITFRQVADEYMSLKAEKIRASTFAVHEQIMLKHILPYFGDWKIQNIRRVDIEKYFISKKNMATATLKDHRGIMRNVLQYALNCGYLYVNPIENFKIEVGKAEKTKSILDSEQMEKLLSICKDKPTWLKVGIMLMAEYGFSRSEVLGIMRDDVDTVNHTIHIQRALTMVGSTIKLEATKNKYRNRIVPVSDETIRILTADPMFYEKDFIVSPYGQPYSAKRFTYHFTEFFRKLQKDHGIPIVTPHALRHSRASLWVAEDKNIFAVAELLGWSDLKMLRQRYAHADVEAIRKQLDI